jgi:hypothetical protein
MPNTDTKPLTCAAESCAMVCNLPAGHKGLHYDTIDDISWKDGKPDA